MKKNILKKTYNLILVCIMLSLVLVGIMGIVYNFNGNLDKIISGYKISDILVPYNEYELIPSAKIVETEAYIDKDGNVIRKVPSKTELGNIDLPKKEEFDEKGNKKKESEKTKTEPVDKEVQEKGYKIGNVDSVICAQKPKLADFIFKMRKNVANVLETDIENISIKATTTEHLGFEGREEGISSQAVVLLDKI